jgi:hypothetical protein
MKENINILLYVALFVVGVFGVTWGLVRVYDKEESRQDLVQLIEEQQDHIDELGQALYELSEDHYYCNKEPTLDELGLPGEWVEQPLENVSKWRIFMRTEGQPQMRVK